MPLMDKVNKQLRVMVNNVNDLKIILKNFITEISKIKIWTASAIDNVQNFGRKKLKPTRTTSRLAFGKVKEATNPILICWPSGTTLLIPKMKNQGSKKNCHQILCLNDSQILLIGLVAMYMCGHVMEKNIWDERRLEAVE